MSNANQDAVVRVQNNEDGRLNDFDIDKTTIARIFQEYNDRNPDNELKVIEELGKEDGIAKKLKVDPRVGLKTDEADRERRVAAFDDNVEEVEPLPHFCMFVWDALGDLMIRILVVAAIVQIILGSIPQIAGSSTEWVDGLSIIFAVVVVVVVGSYTNYSKEKKFKQMSEENKASAEFFVFRDGKNTCINPDEILVGDIIPIKLGDILQADGMIISGSGIKIDESPLTGESDLMDKETYDGCMDYYYSLKERHPEKKVTGKHAIPSPLIFSGTEIKHGVGSYLVLCVGKNSVAGQIKETIKQSQEDSKTPLENKLDDIAGDIGKFGLAAAIVTLVALFIRFGVIYSQKINAYNEWHALNPNDPTADEKHPKNSIAHQVLSIILLCVAIVVVAIPEGLPLAVTLSLSFSIKKMNDEKNLVRTMHACETMGNANYICTDKTGTLTTNIMSVSKLFDCSGNDLDVKKITGKVSGDQVKGSITSNNPRDNFKTIEYYNLLKILLAVNTELEVDQEEKITKPSKTDLAFANLLHYFGEKIYALRIQYYPKDKKDLKVFTFSSGRKRMSTMLESAESRTGYRMYIKGASEYIISSISHYLDPTTNEEILCDDTKFSQFQAKIHEYACQSLRTIGLAYKDITKEEFDNYAEYERSKDKDGVVSLETSGFVLLGIAGIEDTLKKGVPEAVLECGVSGINVIMVTGDNKETAIAIAKQAHILPKDYQPSGSDRPDYIAMTGEEFFKATGGLVCINCWEKLQETDKQAAANIKLGTDVKCDCPKNRKEAENRGKKEEDIRRETVFNKEEFRKIVKTLRVVARSKPLDKYLLVFGLKEEENIVAVTGDGTNDAPALSKASVGFAMNEGTDIAKNASDIIIVDNNFASIVTAVLWGRNIYDSIRKFIQFQLCVNISACVLVFVTACIGNETPLTAIQMLWVNMIMDSLGSLALSTEKPDRILLKRKPYGKSEYIINWRMWKHIIVQSMVLIAILLFLYIHAPFFIIEDSKYRIAESNLLLKCFGELPGRGIEGGNVYILDGSSAKWAESAFLKTGYTSVQCGEYARASDLLAAFKVYEHTYGNTSHMTIIFNTFVLYVLCNQVCARFLEDQLNIFHRILINPLFIIITALEFGLQAILVQFGSIAFHTSYDGLTASQWGICFGFALICFVVNFVLKFIPMERCLQAMYECMRCKNKVHDTSVDNAPAQSEMVNLRPKVIPEENHDGVIEHQRDINRMNSQKKSANEFVLKKKLTSIGKVPSNSLRHKGLRDPDS
jgi:Ca2+ transporting ATPase